MAVFVRYGGSPPDDKLRLVGTILNDDDVVWARRVGTALRLAETLAGGMPEILAGARLRRDGAEKAFKIVSYDDADIEFAGIDDSKIARQAFGRGLCPVGDRFVAGGSSPSTITLYVLETNQKVGSVNLSMDIRNAIHGLEVWPYDE
jgi:hypothetical protein